MSYVGVNTAATSAAGGQYSRGARQMGQFRKAGEGKGPGKVSKEEETVQVGGFQKLEKGEEGVGNS